MSWEDVDAGWGRHAAAFAYLILPRWLVADGGLALARWRREGERGRQDVSWRRAYHKRAPH